MESGNACAVTATLGASARTIVKSTVTPSERYDWPGVICPKSPTMACSETAPLVSTRRLTATPSTLPMLASSQPPLVCGAPLDVTPEKEKLITSPQ